MLAQWPDLSSRKTARGLLSKFLLKGELTYFSGICSLAYQFVREPFCPEEADRLCNACKTTDEKLVVWTLLDTGLRVSELCSLPPSQVLWQQRSLRVSGKGGPYGKRSKKRVVPMSRRIQALLEPYFSLNDKWFIGRRQVQKVVQRVAERARISQEVTYLRHASDSEGHFPGRDSENPRAMTGSVLRRSISTSPTPTSSMSTLKSGRTLFSN